MPLFLIPKAYAKKKLEHLMSEDGLKPLKTPLQFLLTQQLNAEELQVVAKVESLRSQLLVDSQKKVSIHNSSSYDSRKVTSSIGTRLQPTPLCQVSWHRLATNTSIHRYWGTFLYLCATAAQAKIILELGSCVGISGSYLASSKSCQRFITIEGSSDLASLATSNIGQITNRFEVMNAPFDTALDTIFSTLQSGLDLVYLDGQHEKDATLHYFERVIPYLNEGAIVVVDDIYWSRGMTEAWSEIRQWKGFSLAIDLGRIGLCLWGGASFQPKNYSFRAFTDYWKKGQAR